MGISNADEARLSKMLRDGKISQQGADQLRASIQAQNERDAEIEKQLEKRGDPMRRRLVYLLGFSVLFFVLGLFGGMSWTSSPAPAPTVSSSATLNSDTPAGRLIDRKAIQQERSKTMLSRTFSVTIVIVAIAALLGIAILFLYNGLVDARERVNAGWAQVENQYQRRLDLVPVLIDGVKTYMDHERETLAALTEARANALGASKALAGEPPKTVAQMRALETSQGELQSALARLFAVVENYPDLKASQNFLALQDQIEGTENRIAVERRNYNEWSRRYNARILKFPSNVVADSMGFEAKPYFQAEVKALEGLRDPFGRNVQN